MKKYQYCCNRDKSCCDCSLANYGRDCRNNTIDADWDIPVNDEIDALINGAKEALDRISTHRLMIDSNIIDALYNINSTKRMPII